MDVVPHHRLQDTSCIAGIDMESLLNPLSWLIAGALLILLEFFLPGLVVIFLGLGGIATAGLIYAGYIRDPLHAVTCFVLSSIFLLMSLRRIILRFYPALSERAETDEDELITGQEATTITALSPHHFEGRVKYSGTTWPARSAAGEIAAGVRVKILTRQNISLVVQKME